LNCPNLKHVRRKHTNNNPETPANYTVKIDITNDGIKNPTGKLHIISIDKTETNHK